MFDQTGGEHQFDVIEQGATPGAPLTEVTAKVDDEPGDMDDRPYLASHFRIGAHDARLRAMSAAALPAATSTAPIASVPLVSPPVAGSSKDSVETGVRGMVTTVELDGGGNVGPTVVAGTTDAGGSVAGDVVLELGTGGVVPAAHAGTVSVQVWSADHVASIVTDHVCCRV